MPGCEDFGHEFLRKWSLLRGVNPPDFLGETGKRGFQNHVDILPISLHHPWCDSSPKNMTPNEWWKSWIGDDAIFSHRVQGCPRFRRRSREIPMGARRVRCIGPGPSGSPSGQGFNAWVTFAGWQSEKKSPWLYGWIAQSDQSRQVDSGAFAKERPSLKPQRDALSLSLSFYIIYTPILGGISKISGLLVVYFVPILFEQSQTTEMAAPQLPRLHFPQRHQPPDRPENCGHVALRSYFYDWLVVEPPLWKYQSISWANHSQYMEKMFQTTSQMMFVVLKPVLQVAPNFLTVATIVSSKKHAGKDTFWPQQLGHTYLTSSRHGTTPLRPRGHVSHRLQVSDIWVLLKFEVTAAACPAGTQEATDLGEVGGPMSCHCDSMSKNV